MRRWVLALAVVVVAIFPAGTAHAQGHADTGFRPLPDRIAPDPKLPTGTIVAEIRDAKGAPLAGTAVRLGVRRMSVAEGETRSQKDGRTDAAGNATFEGLAGGSNFTYRVTVKRDAATYASQPFNLMLSSGYRSRVHVYPVTRDVKQALVGLRGFLYVVPRDDVFQFELLFRIFNVGPITWVPSGDTVMRLPEGTKAFRAEEGMTDARFVKKGDRGAQLVGTYGPGQHDATFRFQVANEHVEEALFSLTMPPHVAEMRVIAEAAKGMTLDVKGLPDAQRSTNQNGQRVLVTGKTLRRGEPELTNLRVVVGGLPTRGSGRWVAAGIAALIVLLGLLATGWGRSEKPTARLGKTDAKRARQLLLDELVALERAHRSGDVGPRTYDRTRRALVEALARALALAKPAAKKTKSQAA